MVKEVTPNGFITEDPTDEIEVIIKQKDGISADDVIGVTGTVRENKLYAKETIFPDIPINRKITTHKLNLIFSHKISENTNKEPFDMLFSLDSKTEKNHTRITTNPFKIKIQNKEHLHILVYKPPKTLQPKDAILFLKKRHLSQPESQIPAEGDPFFIDTIPDVFWIVSDQEWKENYKGVVLFSCSKNSFAKIKLETRELEFKEITS